MNVFVLCTGRCGSLTFAKACEHITNYTSGHESKIHDAGYKRLNFPDNHIEIDNRLVWFLGRLHFIYSKDSFYVHLKRKDTEVANSFVKRLREDATIGIISVYDKSIHLGQRTLSSFALCLDFVNTVNCNIKFFLQDKPNCIDFNLETAKEDFVIFWRWIKAEGDLNAALKEWDTKYNVSLVI